MSRWSEAYKGRALSHDIVDIVDIVAVPNEHAPLNVNIVNIVIAAPANNSAIVASLERAAIVAEAIPIKRLRKRLTSWAETPQELARGDYCGSCSGMLWWTETETRIGWRCAGCHPPGHLQARQFKVEAT